MAPRGPDEAGRREVSGEPPGSPGEPTGLFLVDKGAGPTSHDIVARARRALGTRRVGHTGTLDPFATGLLLLLAGPATRLAEYFHLLPKTYVATLRWGVETTTHDLTGEEVEAAPGSPVAEDVRAEEPGEEEVREALRRFEGPSLQKPPAFSAKKVGGRRAHRAAREGEGLELPPVPVTVHSLELLQHRPPETVVRAVVSTGTYIRSLARDLGRALGCGAHLTALRRTSIGPFRVEDAVSAEELEPRLERRLRGSVSWWRSPADALRWLPRRPLADGEAERVRSGGRIPAGRLEPPAGGPGPGPVSVAEATAPVALVRAGRLVGVAEVAGEELQPRKVFPDA